MLRERTYAYFQRMSITLCPIHLQSTAIDMLVDAMGPVVLASDDPIQRLSVPGDIIGPRVPGIIPHLLH